MCDGKLSSKRDVVILSIKPKRPDFPSSQKVVPISELLQEWDKLDAYYRGQLLKLTKSFQKSAQAQQKEKHQKHSRHHPSSPIKVSNTKHSSNNQSKSSSYPVNKKHSSSLSSDQFTELFGDENLFSPGGADTNNNSSNNSGNRLHHHHSSNKNNKLLHSKSLNSLFDDDGDAHESDLLPAPPPSSRSRSISNSRKSSLSSVNGNLVVSIPVLSVQQQRDNRSNYTSGKNKHLSSSKYFSEDEDNDSSGVSEDDHDSEDVLDNGFESLSNFLSVPRDNFQVQYGTKQKTRVTLIEKTAGVSPRFIVPIRVAPYKPPQAQGLNGVQIQKILYHKNDKINYASPTTTTARTPDKPPDNHHPLSSPSPPAAATLSKQSVKVSSENNSPVSTVSSLSGTTITVTPPSAENNNATPKQAASQSPPDLSSPKSDQGYKSCGSAKLSPPPVNSTTGTHSHQSHQQNKLKRPVSLTENYSSSSSSSGYGKKQRLGSSSSSSSDSTHSERSPSGYNFLPVTSSNNYAFSSLSTASSYSSSSSLSGDNFTENDHHHHSPQERSRHSSTSSSSSASSARFNATTDNANVTTENSGSNSKSSSSGSPTANHHNSKQKLSIINKNCSFVKPSNNSSSSSTGDHSVFLAPAAVSITDRIIKKASRPQPELIERQRRRRLESNQRKTYALQKGDEHEERESIDLSMKSFEMIWNVPLLSPLRSP